MRRGLCKCTWRLAAAWHTAADLLSLCVSRHVLVVCVTGQYKYGWHALPRDFKCGTTKIVSGRASCDYGIRRRSIDAFNVSRRHTHTHTHAQPQQTHACGVLAACHTAGSLRQRDACWVCTHTHTSHTHHMLLLCCLCRVARAGVSQHTQLSWQVPRHSWQQAPQQPRHWQHHPRALRAPTRRRRLLQPPACDQLGQRALGLTPPCRCIPAQPSGRTYLWRQAQDEREQRPQRQCSSPHQQRALTQAAAAAAPCRQACSQPIRCSCCSACQPRACRRSQSRCRSPGSCCRSHLCSVSCRTGGQQQQAGRVRCAPACGYPCWCCCQCPEPRQRCVWCWCCRQRGVHPHVWWC